MLTTRLVNPLLDDIDIAIRVGQRLRDSDLRSRVLFRSELIVVAPPEVARGLRKDLPAPTVAFRRPGNNEEFGPPVPRQTRLCADDFGIVLDAVRDGVGIGLVDSASVHDDLRSGRLVRVHDEIDLGRMTYWAVYPKAGKLPPRTRALLDAITAATRPIARAGSPRRR